MKTRRTIYRAFRLPIPFAGESRGVALLEQDMFAIKTLPFRYCNVAFYVQRIDETIELFRVAILN